MTDIKLDTQHPDFKIMRPKYEMWEDFYQGGDRVESKSAYMPRHPYETEKQYQIRQQRATYRNHAAPVVTVFSASVWDKTPVRELPAGIEDLTGDVDRNQTTADQFFKSVTDKVASRGVHFVIVDSPKSNAQTKAEAKAEGVRPYFVDIPATSLIDWGFDDQGKLDYIVIHQSVEIEASPFGGHEYQDQYRLWEKDSWEVWVEDEEQDGVKNKRVIDEGVNPLGEIPLAVFMFEKRTEMTGISCLDDVVSLCKRVYMRDSELDKSLFDAAVEIACFFGFEEDELDSFTRSSSSGLRSSNTEASVSYAAPTGRAFDALESAIANDERSIREIALRMVRPDSKQVESADSKKEDRKQLDSQLKRFAQHMGDGETRCWELVGKWMNTQGDIKITYNDDFDMEEMTAELARTFNEMRRNKDISRETFWQILVDNGILRPEFDPVEEATKIESEARSNPAFQSLAGRLAPDAE